MGNRRRGVLPGPARPPIATKGRPPLRLHTRTGRPLGSDSFLSKVETYLGRRVRATPRGRPYGSKDSVRRKRR